MTVPRADEPLQARGPHRFLPSISSFPVLLAFVLIFAVFVFARLNLPDPDTWWHIAVGEEILAKATWPTTDSYSFTAHGHPWRAFEWLGEVLMAAVARGGPRALTALLTGLCVTLFLLLFHSVTLRGTTPKAAFLACIVQLPLAVSAFALRPQLLGYIFLLLTFICLENFQRGRRKALWVLPLLFVLWGNTHGNFVFGLFVLGVYWLGGLIEFSRGSLKAERWTPTQRRKLFGILLLCVLATMLGPYGVHTTLLPLEIALFQPHNIGSIQEWQPMPFDLVGGKLFLFFLLGFCFLQLAFPVVYRLEEIGLLLFAIYAACTHRRFLIFFVLVFTPLLARHLDRWMKPAATARDRPILNTALMVALVGGMIVLFPPEEKLNEVIARRFPLHAVSYIREHAFPPKLYNWYGWGGYLIWTLGPERKVFVDGRADLYEYPGVLSDYLAIERLRANARTLLNRYQVEACLIPRESALATFLASQPEWKLLYADDLSALYVLEKRQSQGQLDQSRKKGSHGSPSLSTTKPNNSARLPSGNVHSSDRRTRSFSRRRGLIP